MGVAHNKWGRKKVGRHAYQVCRLQERKNRGNRHVSIRVKG